MKDSAIEQIDRAIPPAVLVPAEQAAGCFEDRIVALTAINVDIQI